MPTINMPITGTWTKIADASNTELLASWDVPTSIEVAVTATNTAPAVTGHMIDPNSAITRGLLGSGYVWVRISLASYNAIPSINMVVTK